MLAENRLPNHAAFTLTARALFASLFIISGITHFTNIPYYVSLMPDVIPFPIFWTLVTGVVELAGATMVLAAWRPRLGAWLLVLFLVPVTFLVHGYEMVAADTEPERVMQQAHFFKGIALTGAALLITQLGAAHRSVDRTE